MSGIHCDFIRASIKDIDSMICLRIALLKELGEIKSSQEEQLVRSSTKEYLQQAISNNEFISYIARCNGETVGASGVVIIKRPPYLENLNGMEAYILNMYTIPQHRGRGISRKLLESCIDECKNIGVKRVWLHSSDNGKHLYQKVGFTPKSNEMEFFI
ncbi:GNAT family N-acetyltransferase [Metabacillus niabensis]|uniref:GNAT family N-acetyltransferase n=1 Tax=Metabacillus niabensis TaxID=324854 RepID=UPI001CFB613F|nr:GNAT family N-acetyltransferase [Metabacillus niabensis]